MPVSFRFYPSDLRLLSQVQERYSQDQIGAIRLAVVLLDARPRVRRLPPAPRGQPGQPTGYRLDEPTVDRLHRVAKKYSRSQLEVVRLGLWLLARHPSFLVPR